MKHAKARVSTVGCRDAMHAESAGTTRMLRWYRWPFKDARVFDAWKGSTEWGELFESYGARRGRRDPRRFVWAPPLDKSGTIATLSLASLVAPGGAR